MKKKVLVLDLDETLVHSTMKSTFKSDFQVEVLLDKRQCLYHVLKRPHCDLFLRKVSEWFKLVIFTASIPEYADPVLDYLDPARVLFSKRFFRDSCLFVKGSYTKDLQLIEEDLSNVFLLDNSNLSFLVNPGI
jgi:CTD nuclear envelope phosphatase 1